jgi:clan AA aspartic protease
MITGQVRRREGVVPLKIVGSRGRTLEIQVIVDTGFTVWLTLPSEQIETLGLRRYGLGRAILGDGSLSVFEVYVGKIMWHGRIRRVRVNALDAAPMIGMSLLRGCELKMQVRRRGQVIIEPIS